jgi:hypothetical protein
MLVLLVAICAGCGGPKFVPVSGVVTLDGQPVANAGVMFLPVDKGPACGGTTNADGKFDIMTTNRRGVAPGPYHVTVTKREVSGRGMFDTAGPKTSTTRWIVPERYSNVSSSKLEADVKPGAHDFVFELTTR